MGLCELCGRKEFSCTIIVEGSSLNVCSDCSGFGKVVHTANVPKKRAVKTVLAEDSVKNDFFVILKQCRERMNLTQKEFAEKIMEKENTVHKLETGHLVPGLELARKLEKLLKIALVEHVSVDSTVVNKKESNTLTIGDVIELDER
ncbi:TIGR00270 family protein [Candidatus Woesearchaeota archaeon]|nr:TIGR00270 family protein [Candidatus Woesearchaeota archaeon]